MKISCSSATSVCRSRSRRAAISKPEVSKIWLPMWLCRPRRRRESPFATMRSIASLARPFAREKPNFWSSWAVAMNSWVCASTPTVTRTMTGATTPSSAAISATRSISAKESTTIRPIPHSRAWRSSATDLLLPWSATRSGGKPTRRATAISPAEQVSRQRPSSMTQRATAEQRKALPA